MSEPGYFRRRLFSAVSLFDWVYHRAKNRYKKLFIKLNRLFDDAANGNAGIIPYDESIASALGDKILRYINANKDHLRGVQDERNQIKTLLSDISHQTKTPISNILLYSGLLLQNKDLDENSLQMLFHIQAQSEKLKFLIDALIKMSRLETGVLTIEAKQQPVQPLISAAVSEAFPKLTEKNIAFSVQFDEHLSAKFDMRWTNEALENILENAVKYTEQGGSIKITVAASELFVRIDIADTGAGIAEDEYTDIFKRFYRSPRTSDQDGIGVGLYLAREIIVTQGGYIKVSSKIGKGSVFSIYIPRVTTLRDESTTLQNK